jgi:hypothetical protein
MKDKAAKKDPLFVFFRNQQHFIHLYLLSEGCEVTSQIIRDIMKSMGREFASQTYYGLRRELEQEGWIVYPSQSTGNSKERPGPVEMPHHVPEEKLVSFKKTIISSETVSRPVSVSKYHLFDMGMRFSDIQTLEQVQDLQRYISKYSELLEESADDAPFTLFYPDFIFRGMLEKVVKFSAQPITNQAEWDIALQNLFARLPIDVRQTDIKKDMLAYLENYLKNYYVQEDLISVLTKLEQQFRAATKLIRGEMYSYLKKISTILPKPSALFDFIDGLLENRPAALGVAFGNESETPPNYQALYMQMMQAGLDEPARSLIIGLLAKASNDQNTATEVASAITRPEYLTFLNNIKPTQQV